MSLLTQRRWAIARANALGIIIVSPMGNDAKDETLDTYSKWSGVVGVSAIDTTGKVASYSSWGQGTTVAAVGGPVVVHNYESGNKGFTDGTSNSVPLVAGFLALAKQKWPNATRTNSSNYSPRQLGPIKADGTPTSDTEPLIPAP